MQTIEQPPEAEAHEIEDSLRSVELQLERQATATRRFHGNVMFFGGMLALISLASLVAVAAKLGTKDVRVTVRTPAAAAAKTAAPAALPGHTGVTLKDFTLTPDHPSVAHGKVTFSVSNEGTMKHEFVVLRTDKPAGDLLKGSEADETGNVGEIGDVEPGTTKSLALVLKPGHYALICNLPGHYKAGQYADLTVK